jgi:hypothetical protein
MKNIEFYLSNKGLSMSQATSISNSMNQRVSDIDATMSNWTTIQETILLKDKEIVNKVINLPETDEINSLLKEKQNLISAISWIMESVKVKNSYLEQIKRNKYSEPVPVLENIEYISMFQPVDDEWGTAKLSQSEIEEFVIRVAESSVIGKFIHKGSILEKLRNESNISEYVSVKKIGKEEFITELTVSEGAFEELSSFHKELAEKHLESEKRVNYFKAKVQNLINEENQRIIQVNSENSRKNSLLKEEAKTRLDKLISEYNSKVSEFEKENLKELSRVSKLRIVIPSKIQDTVNSYLKGDNE